jgi:hypothetical protein
LGDLVDGTPLADLLNLPCLQSCYQSPDTHHSCCPKLVCVPDLEPATSVSLPEPHCYYECELLTQQGYFICWTVHINVFEKWNMILWAAVCTAVFSRARWSVFIAVYHSSLFNWWPRVECFSNL